MEEEADFCVRELLSNHLGNQQKVVVVNPDDVPTFPTADDPVSECPVDVGVILP